jgi:hypothetical protein
VTNSEQETATISSHRVGGEKPYASAHAEVRYGSEEIPALPRMLRFLRECAGLAPSDVGRSLGYDEREIRHFEQG